MKIQGFAAIAIAAMLVSGCDRDRHDEPAVTGTGPQTTRNYPLKDFDGVALASGDTATIKQGEIFSISAAGPSDVLDRLKIEVDDDVLKITRKGRFNLAEGKGAVITVEMPMLRKAIVAGSGDMSVTGTAADTFEGVIAGSGGLKLVDARAANTELTIAGSGGLNASGEARMAKFNVVGSGNVEAGSLKTETIEVTVAGSGNVTANARASAKVDVIGSGNVSVTGTKACKVASHGSGKVSCTS